LRVPASSDTEVLLHQDQSSHRVTDFFTFYSLPSTVMNSKKHNLLEAGYLFYYATEVGLSEDAESSGRLAKRLKELIGDAVIVAKLADFDVFNCMTLMDNMQFIDDLKVSWHLLVARLGR
jgi:glycylpeptide N-tetradecanoyltransferase